MLQVPIRQSAESPAEHCCALDGGVVVESSPQATSMAAAARVAKILIVIKSSF
jgi:hypothetical protein